MIGININFTLNLHISSLTSHSQIHYHLPHFHKYKIIYLPISHTSIFTYKYILSHTNTSNIQDK